MQALNSLSVLGLGATLATCANSVPPVRILVLRHQLEQVPLADHSMLSMM